ncbi:MAG: hypothetical protein ACFFD6_01070 [Candidatus Thorarchaeota archaeon]
MEVRDTEDYSQERDDLRIAIRERRLTAEEHDRLYHEIETDTTAPETGPNPFEVYRLYYEEGLSQKNVAKKLGFTEWAVRKVFRRYGFETRSIEAVHSNLDHNEVCELFFSEGWSQKRIAEKTGLSKWEVRRILSGPRVEALEDPRLATLNDASDMVEISRVQYEEMIRRNPELRLMRSFDEKHRDVLAYFDLRELLTKGAVDHIAFAHERVIYYGKVAKWAKGVSQPTLLVTAYDCELRRLYKEAHGSLPEVEPDVVHENREEYEQRRIIREWAKTTDLETLLQSDTGIELERTRPALRRISLTEVEGILDGYDTPLETLAELVEYALGHPSRVTSLDLSEVESWKLSALRETFLSVPEAVELIVMERIRGDPFRVGLVDDMFYVWKPDSSLFNLMNIYSDLYFYFNDRSEIAWLFSAIGDSLSDGTSGLRVMVDNLEELVSEMFPETGKVTLVNDNGRDYRILGKHLHLLLDMAALSPSQLEGRISKVTNCHTGQGGIENPKLLVGEELEIALARLAASILCDGHIMKRNSAITYCESNLNRIRIFQRGLQQFGNVRLPFYWDKEDAVYTCYMSSVFGIILQQLGLKAGDKTVENPQLEPEFIEGLSWKALCAFIEDTLPEDGTVGPGTISCAHSMALHAGNKTASYGFTPLVGPHHIELIKSEGMREDDLDGWRLQFGKLEHLRHSKDAEMRSAAKSLHAIAHGNPSNFLLAEYRILERIHVTAVKAPVSVSYYNKTGRVSVAWRWTVTGDDAIRLAIIAPPNDSEKRGILRNWLLCIPEEVSRIEDELTTQNIEFKRWWIGTKP